MLYVTTAQVRDNYLQGQPTTRTIIFLSYASFPRITTQPHIHRPLSTSYSLVLHFTPLAYG